jgi:hypothetical protein
VHREDDEVKELRRWFARWADEAQGFASKKARFDAYMQKLDAAKGPFRKREAELLAEKRKRDKDATLTADEREAIWRPFGDISRRIEEEVYGDNP